MSKEKNCYDCNKEIKDKGVTVGRMSCSTIWVTICKHCDDTYKKSEGYKKVQRLLKSIKKNHGK